MVTDFQDRPGFLPGRRLRGDGEHLQAAATPVAQASTKRSHPAPFSIRLEDQQFRYVALPSRDLRGHHSGHTPPTTTTTTTTIPPTTTTTLLPTTSTTTSTTTTTTTTLPPPVKKPSVTYATKIVPGNFDWRFDNLTALRAQWQVGTNKSSLSSLLRFQYVHNLTTTGQMDAWTWQTLTSAIVAHKTDPNPYDTST